MSYSQLVVGQEVSLAGQLQLVLQPELFSVFSFFPEVGDTFDLIIADGGISLSDTDLEFLNLVTADGAAFLSSFGFTLTAFDSGLGSLDPDALFLIDEQLFDFTLVNGGTTLRATLIQPIPTPGVVSVLALVGLGAPRRRRK